MRYRKVLLLNAAYKKNYYDLQAELPVGLGYIAEALKREGIEYDVLDMDLGYKFKDLVEKVFSFKPELIGLSMMSPCYKNNYELIGKIKNKFPSVDLVVGGPHISLMKEKVMEGCRGIDLGVLGEGEMTMVKLCRGEELKSIKGLLFREDGEIINTGPCDFIQDLDFLGFPKYERFELGMYKDVHRDKKLRIPLSTSRGCPYSCTFCMGYISLGKKFRPRSVESVVKEMEYWYQEGHKDIRIIDDNFTMRKERVYEICDEIKKKKLSDLRLSCDNGIRADKVDKDLLLRMREVGFWKLDFGVEAGNNRILKNIKKKEKIEVIEEAIKVACEVGFDVELTFLIGSPGETWSDIQDGVDLALKYPIVSAEWYHIEPYPGTKLHEWLRERGFIVKAPHEYLNSHSRRRNYPIFITPELSLKDRKKAWKYTRRVIKKIIIRATKRKLGDLKILGKVIACIYGNFLLRNLFIGNNIIREFFVYPVRKRAKLSP